MAKKWLKFKALIWDSNFEFNSVQSNVSRTLQAVSYSQPEIMQVAAVRR